MSDKKIEIVDSDDVNIKDSSWAIDSEDNVYYIAPIFECIQDKNKNDDPVYRAGKVSEWQEIFDQMDDNAIKEIERLTGHSWIGKASASTIDDYDACYPPGDIMESRPMCLYRDFVKMLDHVSPYNIVPDPEEPKPEQG